MNNVKMNNIRMNIEYDVADAGMQLYLLIFFLRFRLTSLHFPLCFRRFIQFVEEPLSYPTVLPIHRYTFDT